MDRFRVRLNCVDSYQAAPSRFDPQLHNVTTSQRQGAPTVPVIRVFGSTETGQKVCAHIHGAFPYMYIEYHGSLTDDDVNAYILRLYVSINHALNVSYRRSDSNGFMRYVAKITLVKGVPFYGFHVGYRFFLKIYTFNPIVTTRLADLLRQGAILNQKFQPYEAHIQFIPQWMMDYNLYGCGYIDCRKAFFRYPVPSAEDAGNHLWHDESISRDAILRPDAFPRLSHCAIEVDICVEDITNRHQITSREIHHDFVERFDTESKGRLVPSMEGLWRDETRRRKARMPNATAGSTPFPPEVLISMSADPRNSQPGGWIHEAEYMDMVRRRIDEERSDKDVSFDTFVSADPLESSVQTALASVEDLYPEKLGVTSSNPKRSFADLNTELETEIEVDERRVLSLSGEDEMYSDDEEMRSPRVQGDQLDESTPSSEYEPTDAGALDAQTVDPNSSYDPASSLESLMKELAKEENIRAPVTPTKTSKFLPMTQQRALTPTGTRRSRPWKVDASPSKRFRQQSPSLRQLTPKTQVFTPRFYPSRIDKRVPRPTLQTVNKISVQHNEVGQLQRSPTLSFPVVKNPQDPSTISRLSQSSQGSQPDYKISPIDLKKDSAASSSELNSTKSSEPPQVLKDLSASMNDEFKHAGARLIFDHVPPTASEVLDTMLEHNLFPVIHQDAFYGEEKDAPDRAREYAGREFKLESLTTPFLPDFDPTGQSAATFGEKPRVVVDKRTEQQQFQMRRQACTLRSWEIAEPPPRAAEVASWLERESSANARKQKLSQIEEATQQADDGKLDEHTTSVQHETQYMSCLSLEIHVNTRGSFVPNPEEDEVQCIFWCCRSDDSSSEGSDTGIVVLSEDDTMARRVFKQVAVRIDSETSELDLLLRIAQIVRSHDPDILTGYEVHGGSWGFLIERARLKYDLDLCDEFSRMKSKSHGRFGKDSDRWGFNTTSSIRVTGRHMINIWRAMRGEMNLLQYSMENVVFQLLHRRIPHYSWKDLTTWYTNNQPKDLAKVLRYYLSRVRLDLEILEKNDIIPRTSEQARLLGVDFFSVFSRGSQFKVESLMLRIAKPENFLLVSPSRKQVGGQNALECIPLVMEPQSDFYNGPVLVLDFQSLYPSCMIAYNYCYSTFLGRVVSWRGANKMGFTEYERQDRLLELLKDDINIAPNGMIYAKPTVRKSLLAKMLTEILETRMMVKSGMKVDKEDAILQGLLNNRQLALKLIANVTYGYTSASFSGRMPCSEIADSIVQTGRETLERAIALIHSVNRWGAEVVYGDTDSLFIYLKGRTKAEAFDIGEEIAKTVTDMNPRPVKLKFEKVYHPCVLLAKKRYVGYKYESRDQVEPEFDAKGIETVRRDGTPAEQKIEEKALRILFETADLSLVKSYFQRQCEKIMKGAVSIQDFCYAREVKLGTYRDNGPPPPGALISAKRMMQDARAEPQYGERVPYVVAVGAPGARLIDRCISPEELLQSDHLELDSEYYITKNLIPPLERIFNLVGANVRGWYDEMPKYHRIRRGAAGKHGSAHAVMAIKRTLESYMAASSCLVCCGKKDTDGPICEVCIANRALSTLALQARMRDQERKVHDLDQVCQSCSGHPWGDEIKCDSLDCPAFYARTKQRTTLRVESRLIEHGLGILDERTELDW